MKRFAITFTDGHQGIRSWPGAWVVLLLTMECLPAGAQDDVNTHPFLTDRYVLQAGGFFPQVDFQASVNGSATGDHDVYDFENEFGLSENENIAALEFLWRYRGNWSLRAQYFEAARSETAILRRDIEWGDVVFQAGSNVTAATDVEILRLFFARNFSSRPNHDFGVGLGIHRLGIGLGLTGEFLVDGTELSAGEQRVGFTAPLPNIGAWYDWAPSPKWVLGGRVDWLQATFGDYSGGLTNAAIGANYQLFPNVGVGLQYQAFILDLDVRRQDWNGSVKLKYQGAYLYLSGTWGQP